MSVGVVREPARVAALPLKGVRWRVALRGMVVTVGLVAMLAYGAASTVVADRLTRPNRETLSGTPADVGLRYEEVQLTSAGDRVPLRGWWMPGQSISAAGAGGTRAVVLVHGRGSSRTGAGLLGQAALLHRAGYGVLSFDLRGHGESGGERYSLGPDERRDVMGAVAYARQRGAGPGQVGLLCHSMGAAACLLALPELPDVGAVVADSGFARLTDLLANELPKASGLPSFLTPGILLAGKTVYGVDVDQSWPERTLRSAGPSTRRPVLVMHSAADQRIPAEHARRLWRAAGEPVDRLWIVPAEAGIAHDRIYDAMPAEYEARVTRFFAATLGTLESKR